MRKSISDNPPAKNALVPTTPTPSDEDQKRQQSVEQLLEQFSSATQNPPPGPGGVLGIGSPWDMPAPVETSEEYAGRIRRGPHPNQGTMRKAPEDIKDAEARGDTGFAALREGDLKDATQSSADHGDLRTWLILGGACLIFLLLMLLLIALPHGRDTHPPNIWVY